MRAGARQPQPDPHGRLGPLEDHLGGRSSRVVATFEAILAAAERNGPVTVLPEKTRTRRDLSPRNRLHAFRLAGPDEVDAEVADWLAEAYQVGMHRRLPDG